MAGEFAIPAPRKPASSPPAAPPPDAPAAEKPAEAPPPEQPAAAAEKSDAPAQESEPKHDSKPAEGSISKAAKNYVTPSWASVPKTEFKLEAIKNGQLVESIDISKQDHYVIGRQPDICDIDLEHPSVSRQHAVIQHSETGTVHVYDLNSTHGTSVNKQAVKGGTHHPLNVGDVLRFGQSTRLYVLQGPAEMMPEEGPNRLERAKMKYLQKVAEKRAQEAAIRSAVTGAPAAGDEGISWGFGEDAKDEDEDDMAMEGADGEALLTGMMDDDPLGMSKAGAVTKRMTAAQKQSNLITGKARQVIEKMQEKKKKIDNMNAEIARIKKKEEAGLPLSEGQARQCQRNEEAINKLAEEMEDLEEELRDEMRDRKKSDERQKRKAAGEADSDDSGDDEFFDRTEAQRKKTERKGLQGQKQGPEVLNQERLEQKKAAAIAEKEKIEGQIKGHEAAAAGPSGAAGEEEDEIEAAMRKMKSREELMKIAGLKKRVKELEAELVKIDKYLHLIKPALEPLKPSAPKPAAPPKPAKPAAAAAGGAQAGPSKSKHQPPMSMTAALAAVKKAPAQEGAEGGPAEAKPAEAKPPAPTPPATTPPVSPAGAGGGGGKAGPGGKAAPGSKKAEEHRIDTTKAGLQIMAKDGAAAKHKPQPVLPAFADEPAAKRPRPDAPAAPAAPDADVEVVGVKEEEWVPPSNQRGDGRTALNDKFGY